MPTLIAPLEEAREHLRVIRQTMERSTKYSTLSGLSGVLIGLTAIAGVLVTRGMINRSLGAGRPLHDIQPQLAGVWLAVLAFAVAIEFLANKRRAARVGKRIASPLGAHILLAALPAFLAAAVLSLFFYQHGLFPFIWGIWMLCYGLAISAVGLFSVRPVSYLGAAFVLAGAVTLLLPGPYHLFMMALTFGGFHIFYGVLMARRHGW